MEHKRRSKRHVYTGVRRGTVELGYLALCLPLILGEGQQLPCLPCRGAKGV